MCKGGLHKGAELVESFFVLITLMVDNNNINRLITTTVASFN